MKKIHLSIISLCIIASLLSLCIYGLFSSVVRDQAGYVYYLKPGTTKKVMIKELTQQGIVTHPLLLSLYISMHPDTQLKSGEYLFPHGSNLISIWKQLTMGTGHYYRSFAIIPGWSFTQLRHALLQVKELHHTINSLTDKQVMQHLGEPFLSPEGEFFPDTYKYTRGVADVVILKRAFHLMQSKLNKAWQVHGQELPYQNAYEALIAASLIEKEAYLNTERGLIAGVLTNRLKKNMLLQFDPTVIYGLGSRYRGKIYKEDLLDNNPYNTYVHRGLPPTPIAMPSLLSIEAAMHPKQHDYFYFVAKEDGSHQFSKTLDEHKMAVDSIQNHRRSLHSMTTTIPLRDSTLNRDSLHNDTR